MSTSLEAFFSISVTILIAPTTTIDELLALPGEGVVIEHVLVFGALTTVDGHLADVVHRCMLVIT